MNATLPPVGTNRLLELLAPYVPDDFITEICPRDFTGGRRHALSGRQLWRVHLLALLTSTHLLNLLVAQLPEQAAWRRFARLNRASPTARMLHEFRQVIGVGGLRQVNRHLVGRLLQRQGLQAQAVALMDATDLPAACNGFKKKFRALHCRARGGGRTHPQDRSKPMVCRLQKAHFALVAAHPTSIGDIDTAGQLDYTRQCGRGRIIVAESAVVSPAFGLVAGHRGGGHGLCVRYEQTGGPRGLADGGGDQTAGGYETGASVCECQTDGMSARTASGMVGV